MGKVMGNSTTVSYGTGGQPLVTSSAGLGTVHNYGNVGITKGGPGVTGKVDVPLGGTGKTVPTTVTNPFTKPSFAKAMVASAKIAGRLGGGVVGAVLIDAAVDYGINRLRMEDGELKGSVMDEEDFIGTKYIVNNIGVSSGWKITLEDACDAWASALSGRNGYSAVWITRYLKNDLVCHYSFTYNGNTGSDGLYVTKKTNEGTEVKEKTIGEQEIEDKIARDSGWPDSSARALQGMLGEPDVRKLLEPSGVNIVGPTAVPGQKTEKKEQVKLLPGTNVEAPPGTTTKTDSGTKTTTSTEQHKVSYDGDKVSHTTVTNNITNITNNVTNITTTDKTEETTTEDDKKPDFCEANPDSLMCKKIELDTPEGEVKRETATVTYAPEDLGLGAGSCPADRQIGQYTFSYASTCAQLSSYGRALVLALSTVTALIIIFGGRADA